VLFHYFERFLEEYEYCFEREYGFLRPVIQEVTAQVITSERSERGGPKVPREGHEIATSLHSSQQCLDCGNPKCGFARINFHPHLHYEILSFPRIFIDFIFLFYVLFLI